MIEQLKHFLRDQVGMPPSVALLGIGLVFHLLLTVVLKKSPLSPWGLLAPLALGIAVEGYEIWVQYRGAGCFAAGNDPVIQILARHSVDVLKVLSLPALLVSSGYLIHR